MVMLAWPMMYCKALGFIPAFAIRVQNVCRKECGVILGNGSLCCLLYFFKRFLIQGYQLFEKGDYNSDIVVIQLPLDAKENIQQVGLSCPVSPDYAGGDIEFEVVEEQDNYDLDDLNVDDFYRWTKMGVPCSKLLGWCEKEIIPSDCAFLGWLADEDPFVIGNGYNLCFFLTPEGKVIASYRAPC